MDYYALSRCRFDTILHPREPASDLQLRLYSTPMTPRGEDVQYRYTVRLRDLRKVSSVDDAVAQMETWLKEQSDFVCRVLHAPVVYLRRERWNGRSFEPDVEVGWLRRCAARFSRALFDPELPIVESPRPRSATLFRLALDEGASIVGASGTWRARLATVTLTRSGDLRIEGTLRDGGPTLGPVPADANILTGSAGPDRVSADEAPFREVETVPVPGSPRRFSLQPSSVQVGRAGTGSPERTSILVRRVPQVWSTLSLTSGGRQISIEPLRGTAPNDFAAWIRVRSLPTDAGDEAEVVGVAVSNLLSVAHRSRIPVVAIEKAWSDTRLVTLYENTRADPAAPAIPPSGIASYLDQALPTYLAMNDTHRLFALVEYYVRSFIEDTADHRFTFASIFMEAFKFSWADNDGAADMIVDRKASGLVRGFERPPKPAEVASDQAKGKSPQNRRWSFSELMNRYASAAAGPAGFTFIENRNALFHSGLPAAAQTHGTTATYPLLRPELARLQVQMEDVLLSVILGYTGRLWEYGTLKEVQYPARTPV